MVIFSNARMFVNNQSGGSRQQPHRIQQLGRYWVLYLLNVVSMLFAIYEFRDDDR